MLRYQLALVRVLNLQDVLERFVSEYKVFNISLHSVQHSLDCGTYIIDWRHIGSVREVPFIVIADVRHYTLGVREHKSARWQVLVVRHVRIELEIWQKVRFNSKVLWSIGTWCKSSIVKEISDWFA